MSNRPHALSREAFERLVRDHHAAVYASSLRLVRDPAAALDVTQQVYLAVLEGRLALPTTGHDEVERVLRWFAVRGSLAELRAGANRRRREDGYAMDAHEVRSQGSDHLGADLRAEAHDERRVLARAVDALPDDLRVALRLRFDEDRTYAAIGDALAISEPSAHERVRRALERLRELLTRGGHAVLAASVEERLSDAARASVPAAPAEVAARLLALHTGTAVAVSSFPLAAAAVLALLGAAALWIAGRAPASVDESRTTALAAPLDAPSMNADPAREVAFTFDGTSRAAVVSSSTTASPAETPSSSEIATPVASVDVLGHGRVRGVLLDADGTPAVDRVVKATSVELQGKFPRHSASARSANDGTFWLDVEIGAPEGTNYVLSSGDGGAFVPTSDTGLVRARRDAVVDAGTRRLAPARRDAPGDFTLDVSVVDAAGRPVPEVVVVLHRRVRTEGSFGASTWEAGGRVDAAGRVRLTGAHVGPKRLSIDARSAGHRRCVQDFDLDVGAHARTITLEPGLEIRGRLVDVAGRAIVRAPDASRYGRALQIHTLAPGDEHEWILGDIEDDGSFVLRGLDPGDYTLEIGGEGNWSPICRSGVVAGDHDVRIALKKNDDARDVGDHCGEIHGRLVDAATRAPVLAPFDVIEVCALETGIELATARADAFPLSLRERPVQREFSGVAPEPSDAIHATGLAAGTYFVAVRVEGYATAFLGPVALGARELKSDFVVELERPVTVRGRVVDREGRAVADAWVRVGGVGPSTQEAFAEADRNVATTDGRPRVALHDLVRTDAAGRFEIRGVPPSMIVTVAAFHPRHEPVVSVPSRASSSGEVEVRFARGR